LYERGYRPDGNGGLRKPSKRPAIDGGAEVRVDDLPETPELERDFGNGALGACEVQSGHSKRVLVRVTSFRKRLLDEDNLCEKYLVDLLRYAGVIPGDEADKAKIKVRQVKVGKAQPEKTVIEVFDLE
jgi:hypothetical protein